MIEWKESYSTGVETLDKQHRSLFQYTNDLGQAIEDNVLSRRTLDETFRLLNRYIKVHFGQEEDCMFKLQCPIANKNKDAHQKFIDTFQRMEQQLNDELELDDARKLHQFLETWLVEHICKIDTQLKPCTHKA